MSNTRDIVFHLRISEREREQLRRYAKQEQVQPAEAMRLLIRLAPIEREPPAAGAAK